MKTKYFMVTYVQVENKNKKKHYHCLSDTEFAAESFCSNLSACANISYVECSEVYVEPINSKIWKK